MVQIIIPCKHESGEEKDHRKVVPDYHSLTRDEIKELLEMAKALNPVMETGKLSQIQVRLNQGIMGMTCPRPADSRQVANNMFLVDKLFTNRFAEGATPDLVDAFDSLLYWHQ